LLLESCIVCNENNCLTYYDEENNALTCNICKSMFREIQNSSKEIDFVDALNTPSILEKIKTIFTHEKFWKLVASEYINYLKNKTDMSFKNALDIGSFFGNFVIYLCDLGIDAIGIEADRKRVELAATDRIKWGYFDETFKSEKKFDLISFTQVLYYFPNTVSILRHAKSLLKPNGLIFISTLNPESSYFTKKIRTPFKTKHTNIIFSKKAFQSLEEKIGLKMIDYTTLWPSIFTDLYQEKSKMVRYFLKMKKPYKSDPDGFHVFLLLKPIT